MRVIAALALLCVALTSTAAASTGSLLPAVGSSVTFTATSHTDTPHHHNGGFHSSGPGGGPGGGGSGGGGFASFTRDQNGTITFARDASGVEPSVTGDLDTVTGPLGVSSQGVIDPGSPPNRFVVAFDNASAIAEAMPARISANSSWSANVQFQPGPDASLQTVPLTTTAVSVAGDDVKIQGSGKGTASLSTPMGDQTADISVTVNAEIKGGQLQSYTQQIAQTMSMHDHTFTITTTVGLTAGNSPAGAIASPSPH